MVEERYVFIFVIVIITVVYSFICLIYSLLMRDYAMGAQMLKFFERIEFVALKRADLSVGRPARRPRSAGVRPLTWSWCTW